MRPQPYSGGTARDGFSNDGSSCWPIDTVCAAIVTGGSGMRRTVATSSFGVLASSFAAAK